MKNTLEETIMCTIYSCGIPSSLLNTDMLMYLRTPYNTLKWNINKRLFLSWAFPRHLIVPLSACVSAMASVSAPTYLANGRLITPRISKQSRLIASITRPSRADRETLCGTNRLRQGRHSGGAGGGALLCRGREGGHTSSCENSRPDSLISGVTAARPGQCRSVTLSHALCHARCHTDVTAEVTAMSVTNTAACCR